MKKSLKGQNERKVAIVVLTYNQELLLEICLNSLKKKTNYKNYKVYLVDDSGKGEIGGRIKKKFKWVDVAINKENIGCSKSYNKGMKKALKYYNPDYILLLNDDCEIIEKDWLKKMVEVGETDDKIGILGCQIIYPDGSLQNLGGYIKGWEITKVSKYKKDKIIDVDHVMGACYLIKKNVINKIGLWDEIYTPYLLEDTDYCLRAKEEGFRIISIPFVKIIHKKGKSFDAIRNSKKIFIRFKNDIIFSKRHLKGWNKFFRIFIYLPTVAIFKKKKDTDKLKLKNFKLRKAFLANFGLWIKALFYRN